MLRARWVTLRARWVTLRARWVTLRARWVTLRARWVTLRARWVTLRARWVTLRARWVTLRARWATRQVVGGAGTSGRLAYFVTRSFNNLMRSHGRHPCFRYCIAGGDAALFKSVEGAEDDPACAVDDLKVRAGAAAGRHGSLNSAGAHSELLSP
jgi:hypothetical protein